MSREAWLSLIGMERLNPDLFKDIELPTEWNNEDVESFKLELFAQTAEMELLYSDSKIMQQMISAWSHRRRPIWDSLYETLHYEYNPLSNWDRDEERTVTETRDLKNTSKSKDDSTRTDDLKQTNTSTGSNTELIDNTETITNSNSSTTKVAGFNSDTLVNREGSTSTDNNSNIVSGNTRTNSETSGQLSNTGTQQNKVERTGEGTDTGTITTVDKYKAFGNVGVLSPQELIQKQREIVNFDLMQIIIDEFIKRFCILIY